MTIPHHSAPVRDTQFATPTALMLDARLTPLERNGWQVLRMLRSPDGISSLASLGQLRRYLTSIPLGQKAGYETAWRVLMVLRLTGWISLIGQHRDPLTGHVLNELYRVHEQPQGFAQACELDPGLPQLLRESAAHDNNQVSRVAAHIQASLAQGATARDDDSDDTDPPASGTRNEPPVDDAAPDEPGHESASRMAVTQQTGSVHQATQDSAPTYSKYKYKERTYRAREEGVVDNPASAALPPCLHSAKPRQQQDIHVALRRLPEQQRRDVLDELEARSQSGTVRNAIAYFFGLIKRVLSGEFRLWAGRKLRQSASLAAPTAPTAPAVSQQPAPPPSAALKPADPEIVKAHIASIRSMLNRPANVGELAARLMQDKGWRPGPA